MGTRLKVAAVLGLLVAAAVEARLFDLQILRFSGEAEGSKRGISRSFTWTASRGLILDRNGRRLVANTEFETLVAHPLEIGDSTEVAQTLAPILGVPTESIERRLRHEARDGGKSQAKNLQKAVRRCLSAEAVRELRDLKSGRGEPESNADPQPGSHPRLESLAVEGLALLKEPDRYYLKRELAGQLIGWVDIDNVGCAGIEKAVDSKLKGTTTVVEVRRYGDRRFILESDYTKIVPLRGADVMLALDETVQWLSERALFAHCASCEAKAGMAIVMEPHTGEILAMANYPSFDPEKVGEYASNGQMERAKNHCVTDLFEPGSTMKPFIVAAGLESGAITLDTRVDCENGVRYLPRYRSKPIRDVHPMGIASVTDVLVQSSNIGIGKIAEKILQLESETSGRKRLYDYLVAFGFGRKTEVELPGEMTSLLRPSWEEWNLNDVLVLAFGTGPVMVTPVSLARAYCLLANGGVRVTPQIVKGFIGNRDGSFYSKKSPGGERVLSETTVGIVRRMLVRVVESKSSRARSEWYSAGGKTGTAKKVVEGQYSEDHKLLSFVGFAPAADPRVVVAVMLDEPKGFRFGNEAAAPIFRQIVEDVLTYLHVPPDSDRPGLNRLLARRALDIGGNEKEGRDPVTSLGSTASYEIAHTEERPDVPLEGGGSGRRKSPAASELLHTGGGGARRPPNEAGRMGP